MQDQTNLQPRAVILLKKMLALHESVIDCETCGEKLDCFAELVAAGNDPEKVLPAVQNHLECCRDCREVFEALIAILKAEKNGQC